LPYVSFSGPSSAATPRAIAAVSLPAWKQVNAKVHGRALQKWDNLKTALAPDFAHYNVCRIHGSLRITHAMAAGITDRGWTMEEVDRGLNH
jgi:hypothetical protein